MEGVPHCMKKNLRIARILLLLFLLLPLLYRCLYPKLIKGDISDKLLAIEAVSSQFFLGDVTAFSWDIAFVDRDNYDKGKSIKDEHNLKGYVGGLLGEGYLDNMQIRLVFARNGWIVKSIILNNREIDLDESIKIIRPDTLLSAELRNSNFDKVLYLSAKE